MTYGVVELTCSEVSGNLDDEVNGNHQTLEVSYLQLPSDLFALNF